MAFRVVRALLCCLILQMWYLTSLHFVLYLLAMPTTTFCTRCSIKPFMIIPILHRVVPNSTSLFLSLSCEMRSWAHLNIPDDVGVQLLVKLMCDLFWGSKMTEKVFVPVESRVTSRTIHVHAYNTTQGYPKMQFSSVIHPPIPAIYCPSLHPS